MMISPEKSRRPAGLLTAIVVDLPSITRAGDVNPYWPGRTRMIAPDGLVMPCHDARDLPLEFWSVAEKPLSDCWGDAPGMNAFRGEEWMPEPCASCPERAKDFGGCRCQAFRLTGDAAATDPACALAPQHALLRDAREPSARPELILRGASGRG